MSDALPNIKKIIVVRESWQLFRRSVGRSVGWCWPISLSAGRPVSLSVHPFIRSFIHKAHQFYEHKKMKAKSHCHWVRVKPFNLMMKTTSVQHLHSYEKKTKFSILQSSRETITVARPFSFSSCLQSTKNSREALFCPLTVFILT